MWNMPLSTFKNQPAVEFLVKVSPFDTNVIVLEVIRTIGTDSYLIDVLISTVFIEIRCGPRFQTQFSMNFYYISISQNTYCLELGSKSLPSRPQRQCYKGNVAHRNIFVSNSYTHKYRSYWDMACGLTWCQKWFYICNHKCEINVHRCNIVRTNVKVSIHM